MPVTFGKSDWSSSVLKFQPIKRKPTVVAKPIIKARNSSSTIAQPQSNDADDIDELEAFSKDIESANSGAAASIPALKDPVPGASIFKPPVRNLHYGMEENVEQTELTMSLEYVNGFQQTEHAKAIPRKRKAGKVSSASTVRSTSSDF